MSTSTLPSRILPLTSWRGIFCICIALFHSNVEWMTEMTGSGVVFFFIASGFLLGFHHNPEEMRGSSYWAFVKSRMKRIYPLHWLTLVLLILISMAFHYKAHLLWPALIPNIMLLQSYIPFRDWYFSFNSVSWFLSSILFCYFCYPFVARALHRMSLKGQLILFAVLTLIYWVIMAQFKTLDGVTYTTHISPIMRLFEFSIGIVTFHCYKALMPRIKSLNFGVATLLEGCTLVLLFALVIFSEFWTYSLKDCFNDSIMWEIPVALLIFVAALCAGREGFFGRILSWHPLVWLGNMSLELFLFQGIAGLLFNYLVSPICGHFGFPTYEYYAVGLLPVLILISWLCHKYFTIPLAKKFK